MKGSLNVYELKEFTEKPLILAFAECQKFFVIFQPANTWSKCENWQKFAKILTRI